MSLPPEIGQGPLLEPCRILMWVTGFGSYFPSYVNRSHAIGFHFV